MKKIPNLEWLPGIFFSILCMTGCTKDYSYEGSPGILPTEAKVATGILGGSPGACTPVILSGSFIKGVTLTSSNTLKLQVDVHSKGSYLISTNTVNGIHFSSSGNFSNSGVQDVIITGAGVPVNTGVFDFIVSWGSSSCNFSVSFTVQNLADYFPTTLHSNWGYSADNGTALDSLFNMVTSYAPGFTGNTYACITTDQFPSFNATDSAYYRKRDGDYYQYLNMSSYFLFDDAVYAEYIFLKDNVAEGTTWQTSVYSGTVAGFPGTVTGYINMTLSAKAIAVSVGGFNFPDVIKVHYEFHRSLPHGDPFAVEDRWFARGVGIIYDNVISTITSFQVNTIARYMVY